MGESKHKKMEEKEKKKKELKAMLPRKRNDSKVCLLFTQVIQIVLASKPERCTGKLLSNARDNY